MFFAKGLECGVIVILGVIKNPFPLGMIRASASKNAMLFYFTI